MALPDTNSDAPAASSAGLSFQPQVLRKRADFLAAAKGRRAHLPGFVLQARHAQHDTIRVGFTCSKKVGNAVARNRAKRRLREIARQVLPNHGHPGWDYVLIGRAEVTAQRPFDEMLDDLRRGLAQIHGGKR